MIAGIGIDLIEIKRIHRVMKRQKRFPERILTVAEIRCFERLGLQRRREFLAGRFAAKEAYAKAQGSGIGKDLSWQDIEISPDETGKPSICVKTSVNDRIHLSISHTKEYAVAQVVIESS